MPSVASKMRITRAFTPAAPVNTIQLFAGRTQELDRVLSAIGLRGRHVVLFGERGVGKTSLAMILSVVVDVAEMKMARCSCDRTDTFGSIWRKALERVTLTIDEADQIGFTKTTKKKNINLAQALPDDDQNIAPEDVRKALELTTRLRIPIVAIIDEFDRVPQDARSLFADLIKTLSDEGLDATVILVGVSSTADELIGDHESVSRALSQIRVPRMSPAELHELLTKCFEQAEVQLSDAAANRIVLLSQGLPHYAHLVGLHTALAAFKRERNRADLDDVSSGMRAAVDEVEDTVRRAHHRATMSARDDALYKHVALAAAFAPKDAEGFFRPRDVQDPLVRVLGRAVEIANFTKHLNEFTSADRERVLEKTGSPRNFRFRFTNPLFPPFVILSGIKHGLVEDKVADELADSVEAERELARS